jgi:hypothetical protein
LLASLAPSRVIIREKVEVRPQVSSSRTASALEFYVESSFDRPIDPPNAQYIIDRLTEKSKLSREDDKDKKPKK